eukprot:gb/GECH01009673.1/.p1 GENE.gb/GECH01009673.1/~~gb/GECH01009673.1/.p1  ORF type:complete len:131 (+),score=9.46 gb/GECH01009673.1/:1-393(+)
MEGAGVDAAMQYIKLQTFFGIKFNIATFTHDKDGCSASIIQYYFPDSVEQNDKNHSKVNITKSATAIKKGIGAYCGRANSKAITEALKSGDPKSTYVSIMKAYPFHIVGNHRFCTKDCNSEGKFRLNSIR